MRVAQSSRCCESSLGAIFQILRIEPRSNLPDIAIILIIASCAIFQTSRIEPSSNLPDIAIIPDIANRAIIPDIANRAIFQIWRIEPRSAQKYQSTAFRGAARPPGTRAEPRWGLVAQQGIEREDLRGGRSALHPRLEVVGLGGVDATLVTVRGDQSTLAEELRRAEPSAEVGGIEFRDIAKTADGSSAGS